jgi:hypothetical protein
MRVCFLALALSALPAAADAAVEVAFVSPEAYADAGSYPGDRVAPATLRELARHLERLGAARLPEGRSLKIEVLDLDLAGHFEPWRATAYNVRILRETTWPRIALRYVLTEDGRELARGEEKLSDLNYLDRPGRRLSGDPLRYEKAMLDDWFRARFPDERR